MVVKTYISIKLTLSACNDPFCTGNKSQNYDSKRSVAAACGHSKEELAKQCTKCLRWILILFFWCCSIEETEETVWGHEPYFSMSQLNSIKKNKCLRFVSTAETAWTLLSLLQYVGLSEASGSCSFNWYNLTYKSKSTLDKFYNIWGEFN